MTKLEAAPGPHSSRQIDRRQKSTAPWMAVRPEFRLPFRRQEIQPVPQRRHRIAGTRRRIVAVESGRQRLQRPRSYPIMPRLGAADPILRFHTTACPLPYGRGSMRHRTAPLADGQALSVSSVQIASPRPTAPPDSRNPRSLPDSRSAPSARRPDAPWGPRRSAYRTRRTSRTFPSRASSRASHDR